jgi:hypothetical protein
MNLVDVAIENKEGNYYQFLYVDEKVLRHAVERSVVADVALSMVSSDNSAAIVVPWQSVKRVLFIDVQREAREGTEWTVLWDGENPKAGKSKKKVRKQKKVDHG